jgi:cobalt-zinc-cadmium efflux system outer membrane protein
MDSKRVRSLLLFVIVVLTGCAVHRYQAAPIVPTETASRLESRKLDDPGLQSFVERTLGHPVTPWPPLTWDLGTLSLAGLYFNPALEVTRSHVAEAEAAIVTAGARPNPTLSATPGIPSPYLLGLDLAVPIETAGKRGIRVEQAKNLLEGARLSFAETTWKTYVTVRAALVNHVIALRQLDLARAEEQLLFGRVNLLEARLRVGEIPRPEVDSTRITLSNAQLALRAAEGTVSETKVALAAAIGVPASGLDGAELSWPGFDQLPKEESISADSVRREAVLNRLDVRQALANYAAAESALRLEVAKQYPDIQIAPGYQYEETHSFFTVGASLTLPIFNRNQGPIAEAEARRKGAADTFLATQARVIADSEVALARYRASLQQLAQADQSLLQIQTQREQMSRRALQAGETDQLALSGMLLEGAVATRSRLEVLAQSQISLGGLEDALQLPLVWGELPPLIPQPPAVTNSPNGGRP